MRQDLPIESVVLRSDGRAIDADAVAGLAESIAAVGLINPIRVRVSGDGWEVIAGAHRLSACKSLGLVEIAADIADDDDLHAELAMIDENLCRWELSPAERARQTARRRAIYQELNPETKRGGDHKSGPIETESFTEQTARATGRSEQTVYRDASRGDRILGEVIDLVRGTSLDTGTYLDKLAKLPGGEQFQAATRDLAHINKRDRESARADAEKAKRNKLQGDVKARAAREVADILAEHIPAEWWDALKSNLYAAGASNIAHELTNITGQSVMDRGAA
jgi:ParB-like chromosome segregation protein Spo0J